MGAGIGFLIGGPAGAARFVSDGSAMEWLGRQRQRALGAGRRGIEAADHQLRQMGKCTRNAVEKFLERGNKAGDEFLKAARRNPKLAEQGGEKASRLGKEAGEKGVQVDVSTPVSTRVNTGLRWPLKEKIKADWEDLPSRLPV